VVCASLGREARGIASRRLDIGAILSLDLYEDD
jgi:hypothetical protein